MRFRGTWNVKCEVIDRLRRVWVASPALAISPHEPLPLVLSNGPCIFRNAALGVGVRTERWLEPDLQILDQELAPAARRRTGPAQRRRYR
jgi:hypothetical protein